MAGESQKLPDTCPLSSSQVSQSTPSSLLCTSTLVWGYIFPNKPNLKWKALSDEEYVIGRSPSCHLVLGEEIQDSLRAQLSKEHFRIRRTISKEVQLHDVSFNGTFINGRKIGKGKSAVLRSNDKISLAVPSFDAFIYMDEFQVGNYSDNVKSTYAISQKLGAGAYGEVQLVFNKKTGEGFAMKIINKNNLLQTGVDQSKRVEREIAILKKLSHPFVIKFHDVLDHPDRVFLMVELVRGGDLFTLVQKKRLKELQAKRIFYQLTLAVNYLHSRGIIHRDVKLENILIATDSADPWIKLADFGLSKFLDSQSLIKTYCGTPLYMAPEVLKSEGRPGSYDSQADVWSMGVVLYMCLSGCAPFTQDDKYLPLPRQILTGYYDFPRKHWRNVSHNAIHLVKRMLVVDPQRRITIDKILQHPWLKDVDVKLEIEKSKENEEEEQGPRVKRLKLDN